MNKMTDDQLLQQFFDTHRIEPKDDGFSQRVINRLPQGNPLLPRLWTLVCAIALIGYLIHVNALQMIQSFYVSTVALFKSGVLDLLIALSEHEWSLQTLVLIVIGSLLFQFFTIRAFIANEAE